MKKRTRYWILGWILVGLMPLQGFGQCLLQLSGIITDSDTKEPIVGATITIPELGITVQSNKKGVYLFAALCPGTYSLQVTHTGCLPQQLHLHVKEDMVRHVQLPHALNQLDEVVVTGMAKKQQLNTSSISGKALEATRGASLGEALTQVTGVTVLQTGTNIYKPVIHGLHSNRVLILNNGIRQEGQQWGSEHAPEIDPYVANRLTVIKGASTIRYGGDAIGGVVLVEPKLLPNVPGISGEVNTAIFSNNRQGVLSAIIEGNSARIPAFSWRAQGTIKRGGNARTPNYWLDNSGLSEQNFSLAAAYRKQKSGVELFYSMFNTRLGIFRGSHIGNVTDLMNTINAGDPPDYIKNVGFTYTIDRPNQQVQHQLAKVKAFWDLNNGNKLQWITAGQFNWRREYDIKRFASSSDAPQLDLKISTISSDLVWDHSTIKKLRGSVGLSTAYQVNSYERRLFIPNYQAFNIGAFVVEKWANKKWNIETGLRFDYRNLFGINDNRDTRTYLDRDFASLSGNLLAQYQWNEFVKIGLSVASAWRAPQVNELYSDGLHHSAGRIEKGNDQLTPERANTFQLGLNIDKAKWWLEAGSYFKPINGFIYLEPIFPPELTIRGAFPTFRFAQANVNMYGVDFSGGYRFTEHFSAEGKLSMVRAWNRQVGEWMIQMPPDRYAATLRYEFHGNSRWQNPYIALQTSYVAAQTRIPTKSLNIEIEKPNGEIVMEADYAPPPPAYWLLGAEAGVSYQTPKRKIELIVTGTNLTNNVYRDYLNAFRYYCDEMGTNISLKLKYPFTITSR